MAQYVPNVTEADIERVVKRDYPTEAQSSIFEMIRAVEVREKPRVILACLKNGRGELQKLKGELTNADGYWKDIISEAEYPNYTKKMFRIDRLSQEDKQLLIDQDRNQYLLWLNEGKR
jgi:hypothetical protein